MKREYIHEQRQSADRMEAFMVAVSFVGGVAAILALMSYGLALGLCAVLLSLIAYSISRLFHLFSELFGCVRQMTQDTDAELPPEKKS